MLRADRAEVTALFVAIDLALGAIDFALAAWNLSLHTTPNEIAAVCVAGAGGWCWAFAFLLFWDP